jgi:hypothetical protein
MLGGIVGIACPRCGRHQQSLFAHRKRHREPGILAAHYFTPSSKKAEIPSANRDKVLSVQEIQKLNHFDTIWMAKMLDTWMEKWNRAIS